MHISLESWLLTGLKDKSARCSRRIQQGEKRHLRNRLYQVSYDGVHQWFGVQENSIRDRQHRTAYKRCVDALLRSFGWFLERTCLEIRATKLAFRWSFRWRWRCRYVQIRQFSYLFIPALVQVRKNMEKILSLSLSLISFFHKYLNKNFFVT